MNLSHTEDQLALQDSLRRFLARDYGFEQRRRIAADDPGFSRAAWATYAELGLLALPFAEELGGLGGRTVDAALIAQTLGAHLALEPFVPTVVLAGGLLRDVGNEAQREAHLAPLMAGEQILTLAHHEAGSRYADSYVATTAARQGDGWVLDGHKTVVLAAAAADVLIVSARTAGGVRDAEGISLFLVPRDAAGVSLRPYVNHDATRAADVTLQGLTLPDSARLGAVGQALPALERVLDQARAVLCAEAVGIMAALNDATLEYLKTRKQFGVAIGTFQALKHRMAEMAMAAEQARSMALLAAVKADAPDAVQRRRAVSAAKAYVGQQARFVGQQAVQLHGGMGVTDELIVSHHFKRLTLINASLGDADHHLGRFSELLLAA
ncbi:MAG: acyl-CoA dehydrogenase family protein [Burkholderiales bacterium]|nr:acyl-CoA dehydrogenase family protein [Burkholderiales bacterium]